MKDIDMIHSDAEIRDALSNGMLNTNPLAECERLENVMLSYIRGNEHFIDKNILDEYYSLHRVFEFYYSLLKKEFETLTEKAPEYKFNNNE